MDRRSIFRSASLAGAVMLACLAVEYRANAAPIVTGDIFASIGNGQIQQYDPNLNLIDTLNTGKGGYTTGMAFDSSSNLYVTNFSAGSVSVFGQANGALNGIYGSGYSTPESIVFDKAGNSYVSNVTGAGPLEFNASGTQVNSFGNIGRTDWLDLSSDQHTLLYTSEGDAVSSYDTTTKTANTDFATGLTHGYALRILGNGDVLVADTTNIKLFDTSGKLIRTFGVNGVTDFFALNIDPNGQDFYSGSFDNGSFYKFDLTTGNVLATVNTKCGSGCFYGLAVAGEITQGNGGGGGGGGGTDMPEPASLALLGTGLAVISLLRRKHLC